MNQQNLYPSLIKYCDNLIEEFDLIPSERKEKLNKLRSYIATKFDRQKTPKLIVICTHNSRRSHLGQVWLSLSAAYYRLPDIQTFSGGTEATAFNLSAVNALKNIGLNIEVTNQESSNPVYQLSWNSEMDAYSAFSKRYDELPNPTKEFAAILVCTEADAACPMVLGTDFRLPLPYEDPKKFDGTVLEDQKYQERCRQIGREMLFVMSEINA